MSATRLPERWPRVIMFPGASSDHESWAVNACASCSVANSQVVAGSISQPAIRSNLPDGVPDHVPQRLADCGRLAIVQDGRGRALSLCRLLPRDKLPQLPAIR